MISIIIRLIDTVFNIIQLAILIECIASWMPQLRYNTFMSVISKITYPILGPCRALQDRIFQGSPIDFSPILALFALSFLREIVIRILFMFL